MAKKENKVIKPELPQADLILFDRKTNITLAVLFGCYLLFSFLKMHTSSVAVWDQVFGTKKSKSVLAGSPRPIRQDEWMVSTPASIGQYQNNFPITNPAFGYGNVPVMLGLPVKDFTMMLRPGLWSYFVLDVERAFAFNWNFIIFMFLISMFLALMLITENKFWLSLAGTIFIFSSAAMQWWSYWLCTNIIYLNGIFISFIYLLYSKDVKALMFAGLILLLSSYNFLVSLYPPWQIPLLYLYIFIIVAYLIRKQNFIGIKEKIFWRAGVIAFVGIILLIFGLHYYSLVKDTYTALLNTAYPGKRTTNGGDLIDGKLFSGFFGMYMTDVNVPSEWLNICEASGFIMFFPIVFYAIGFEYFKTKKINWPLILISFYVFVLLIWVLVGFPSFLSSISLLSMSPAYRTLPVLGFANCILLLWFMSQKTEKEKETFSWLEFVVVAIGTIIFVTLVCNYINGVINNFYKSEQITTVTILITAVFLLIRYSFIKYTQIGLAVLLLGMNYPNIKVNPITTGLAPMLDNFLVKETKEISKSDPEARWAVFGNQMLSNLLKINGINVFNGVKNVPLIKDLEVLDSTGKDNFIYNRFAHINMASYVNFTDTMFFKLNENNVVNDNYTICIDPCSPRLQKLGIKYFLFTYAPKPAEIRCMKQIPISGLYLYKRE